jgi:hypothetical protein
VIDPNDPYYVSPEEESAIEERDREESDNLSETIAATLQDNRGDLYLSDIRKIVVSELNKMSPRPGEPAWQTAETVKLPPYTTPAARLDALAYDIYQSLAKLTHDDSVLIARAVLRHYRHLTLENGQ